MIMRWRPRWRINKSRADRNKLSSLSIGSDMNTAFDTPQFSYTIICFMVSIASMLNNLARNERKSPKLQIILLYASIEIETQKGKSASLWFLLKVCFLMAVSSKIIICRFFISSAPLSPLFPYSSEFQYFLWSKHPKKAILMNSFNIVHSLSHSEKNLTEVNSILIRFFSAVFSLLLNVIVIQPINTRKK